MADNGIVTLELETTAGTFYTLWAPGWVSRGEQWQAFLGDDSGVFAFESPAALLAGITASSAHDLAEHPDWPAFMDRAETKVTPRKGGSVSFIDLPNRLAGRPSFENTRTVSNAFQVLRSLGTVCGIDRVNRWFRSYSLLSNVSRGQDHYAGENGLAEWSSVGYTVRDNWVELLDAVDSALVTPDLGDNAASLIADAQRRIDDAAAREEQADAPGAEPADGDAPGAAPAVVDGSGEAAGKDAGDDAVDPYDSTPWGNAGIDPIRITVDGTTVYTLRCYVGNRSPVFLGRLGEINTFPSSRSLVRWIVDAKDHDLAEMETWGDLVTLANAGELEVTVHPSNVYGFTGLRSDIVDGVDAVDTAQLGRAYELLADAADWAKDDGVNKVLLAYPRLQDYIAYMLGSPSAATPTAPFDEEANGWTRLEENLTNRFTKF
ncbi:hypothetical protein [Corynebacterium kalidii]|uniref:Uncharacterized protein n=1 Tax=Corynebacterium kalidii TaxID=2931982 RepID=A0A9X1WFC5_9CORY|nr:hypothetical protein [Corynebacterium kalidii]MCJ7857974.1 hypothetical protein [Corynebacterium kalidii]